MDAGFDFPIIQLSEEEWSDEAETEENAPLYATAGDGQASSSCGARGRSRQHPIYDLYEQCSPITGACRTGSIEFKCLYCQQNKVKTIIKVKNATTSNLIRHIERAHCNKYFDFQQAHKTYRASKRKAIPCGSQQKAIPCGSQQKASPCSSQQSSMLAFLTVDPQKKKELDDSVALMVAEDFEFLPTVESKGFRSLMKLVNCNYDMPSREALTSTILPEMQSRVQDNVRHELGKAEHFALSLETWTSPDEYDFFVLNAHILLKPNGVRKTFCLGVKCLFAKYVAEDVSHGIREILQEYSVPLEQVSSVTTDNGPNIVDAVNLLSLSEKHIQCLGRGFHLIVTKAIKEIPAVVEIFDKCRYISKFFRNTPARDTLKDVQHQNNLPETKLKVDVVTRWNSLFRMGQRILEQDIAIKAALSEIALTDKSSFFGYSIPDAVTEQEAGILKATLDMLEPFLLATETLSEKPYAPSSLVIPIIAQLRESLDALIEWHFGTERQMETEHHLPQETCNRDSVSAIRLLYRTVKDLFRIQFENIESNSVLGKATILDPRCKMFGFRERLNAEVHVKELELEIQQYALQAEVVPRCAPESVFNVYSVAPSRRVESELSMYIAEDLEDSSTDVCSWWEAKSSTYPLLSQLAFKYLCGTATSVPSKQLFTKAGDALAIGREYVEPCELEMLTMVKTNYSECQ